MVPRSRATPRPEVSLDAAACLPARTTLLRVTTAVLSLSERVAAGDEDAAAEVEALATLLSR